MLSNKQSRPENIIDDIVSALGTRRGFSKKSKRDFADAVIRKLAFSQVEEETILPETGKRFISGAVQLEEAISNFKEGIGHTWEGWHIANIALKNAGILEKDVFIETQKFLDSFKHEVRIRTAQSKRGTDNTRALSIAKMIAIEYNLHFGHYPKPGNGEFIESRKTGGAIKLTPYDRVCDIIEKIYSPKGSIKFSTRKAAIKEVKQGGGMKPRKTL